MPAHAYLDKFSIFGYCVILEGWASDFDLALHYDGRLVDLSIEPVVRPDLIPIFGAGAEHWGFVACGALNTNEIDRERFSLRFNSEIEQVYPQKCFSAAQDTQFTAMIAAFQSETATNRGSLLEIGSRARSGTTYRSWFPAITDYVGIDVTAGPNVDIVGDAHHLTRYIDRKFDFIFSIAVFEHILMPWKVAIEMNRVLKLNGLALIISHDAWPLHEEPWDFWRYSKQAWNGIFNKHTGFEILDAQYQHPASIVPHYAHNEHFQVMSRGPAYLLSGCCIRKIGHSKVWWDAEASEIYDLGYSHN